MASINLCEKKTPECHIQNRAEVSLILPVKVASKSLYATSKSLLPPDSHATSGSHHRSSHVTPTVMLARLHVLVLRSSRPHRFSGKTETARSPLFKVVFFFFFRKNVPIKTWNHPFCGQMSSVYDYSSTLSLLAFQTYFIPFATSMKTQT